MAGERLTAVRFWIFRELDFSVSDDVIALLSYRSPKKYLAVKILTAHATQANRDGGLLEIHLLEYIWNHRWDQWNLPLMVDHFELNGPHGDHMCFVVHLLGPGVSSFRCLAPNQSLPVHSVKKIISCVIESLCGLHQGGIVHRGSSCHFSLFWMSQQQSEPHSQM